MASTPTATEFPVEYLETLDEVVEQESFTTKYQVQGAEFVSGRTVKVPRLVIDSGTVDYDHFKTENNAAIVYDTYTLDKDKQNVFRIDALDAIDQPMLEIVKIGSEFERVKLVPEIDTYFFGKAKAGGKTKATENLTAANIKDELRKVRNQMTQNGFARADLYMSADALACLEDALDRQFAGEGSITDTVGVYNIFDIYMVPDARLGVDFAAIGQGRKVIEMVWKRAVSKYFPPEEYQNGDDHVLQCRWVYGTVNFTNQNGGIYTNKGASAPDCSVRPARNIIDVTPKAAG